MKNMKPQWKITLMAVVLGAWLCAPQMVHAENDTPKAKNKPVLAGPKADKESRGDKRFNGDRVKGSDFQAALESLNLTDAQKEQIKAFVVEGRAARAKWQKDNGEQLAALRKQMEDARKAGDQAGMKDAGQKLKDLHAQAPQNAQINKNVRSVLTEEQTKLFEAKMKEIRQNRMANHKKKDMSEHKGKDKKAGKNKEGKKTTGDDDKLDL